jgi:hypothetical protein
LDCLISSVLGLPLLRCSGANCESAKIKPNDVIPILDGPDAKHTSRRDDRILLESSDTFNSFGVPGCAGAVGKNPAMMTGVSWREPPSMRMSGKAQFRIGWEAPTI